MDLSLTPATSWIPSGGADYKLTAKSSSTVVMTEDVPRQKKKETLFLIDSSSLNRQNGLIGHQGHSRLVWRPVDSTP